jgi:hypothetical protein
MVFVARGNAPREPSVQALTNNASRVKTKKRRFVQRAQTKRAALARGP